MAAEKIKLDEPIYVLVTRAGETLYERKFFETPISIGRSLDCDIALPQVPSLSLQHFQLSADQGSWLAVDLNSDAGIFIGTQKFSKVMLSPQQKMSVGEVSVYVDFKPLPFASGKSAKVKRPILSEAWFEESEQGERFAQFDSGIDNLKLNKGLSFEKFPPKVRSLEAYVVWKGQILESRLFNSGDILSVGREKDDLYVPTLQKSIIIGRCENHKFDIYLQKNSQGSLQRGSHQQTFEELIRKGLLPNKNSCYLLTGQTQDQCVIQLGYDIEIHLKFGPAPRQLARNMLRTPDKMLKRALAYSGSAHLAFLLFAFLLMPVVEIPKIKHLPPRVAKLLMQKPKAPEPVAPPPPPIAIETPPVVAKERPVVMKKKVPPVPKKVVLKTNERIKVVQKHVVERAEKPKPDVTQYGALAALGALGAPSTKTNQPVAININKNAGGQTGLAANQVIGVLKSQGGRLQAGGMAGIKTKGKGYGSGSEYGVQGLKGLAGSRGIAGGIVGSPKLMSLERTEGLTREQVMNVVKRHLSRIQQCYERSLLSTPQLSGRVEYEWHIQARGQVEWVKIKQSDLASADTLNHCVMAIFQDMRFPVASNGEATTPSIGFPFGRL